MNASNAGWQLGNDDIDALGEALGKAYTAALHDYLGPKLLGRLPTPDAVYDVVGDIVDRAVTWYCTGLKLYVFPGFDEAGEKIEDWFVELYHEDEDGETRKFRLEEVLLTGTEDHHGGGPQALAAWLREMADKLDEQAGPSELPGESR